MPEYHQYPLILAGPILRRVEPRSVSVWVALSKPNKVSIAIWDGRINTGSSEDLFADGGQPELHHSKIEAPKRVGENLYISLVTLKIKAEDSEGQDANPLLPNTIYSYNLVIHEPDSDTASDDLKSLSLLKDSAKDETPHLALGYNEDYLPSFALSPLELTDLNVLYGSCRRPHMDYSDGLGWVDDFIKKDINHASSRPHQLLLGGDQIYADDVAQPLMSMLMYTAKNLIGMTDEHPFDKNSTKHTNIEHPHKGGTIVEQIEIGGKQYPLSNEFFPHGMRNSLIVDEARMTSTGAANHLLGFGEFCAMYLFVWSNVCWPSEDEVIDKNDNRPSEEIAVDFLNNEGRRFPTPESMISIFLPDDLPPELLGDIENNKLFNMDVYGGVISDNPLRKFTVAFDDDERKAIRESSEEVKNIKEAFLKKHKSAIRKLKRFRATLDKVRRALANVPTYMMFDDHDVTDDWNLNPVWQDRVNTSPLGRSIIRNALTAYTLFQAWGNEPDTFSKLKSNKEMLKQAAQYFKPGAKEGAILPVGPDANAISAIDKLIGLSDKVSSVKWNFSVSGFRHKVVALDNRTQRSYVSRNGPPGNISKKLISKQIPSAPLEPGIEVLIIVAPLPVLGPPVFDELIGQLVYRVFDLKSYLKGDLNRHSGTKDMAGTNPDAIEAWSFDPHTFEALLARLEPYQKVVILSGDVHYASSQVMSYWKKGKTSPARFAQFTSSGMQNVMPPYIRTADRSLSFLQRMLRADIGAERIAWESKDPAPLDMPEETYLVPALKSKLRESPVMIPSYGWPKDVSIKDSRPADWSWRVIPIRDIRPDQKRPEKAQPSTDFIGPDEDIPGLVKLKKDAEGNDIPLAEGESFVDIDGYRKVMHRHLGQFDNLNNSRQILFANNLGNVSFEKIDGELFAKQDLYSVFPFDQMPGTPELYTQHRIQLTGVTESPPGLRISEDEE